MASWGCWVYLWSVYVAGNAECTFQKTPQRQHDNWLRVLLLLLLYGWIYHKYLQSYMNILSWIDMLNKGVELNVKNHPKLFLLPVPPSDIHINTYIRTIFQWIVFKLQYLICKEWQIFLGYKQFLPNIRIPFWEIWIIEFCHTENGRWRHWRIFYYRGEGSSVCITVHSIFHSIPGGESTNDRFIHTTDGPN